MYGKKERGKFIKVVVHVDSRTGNIIDAEVNNSEVDSAVKEISKIQENGGSVVKFYGDKAYDSNEIYKLVPDVVVPPKRSASRERSVENRRRSIIGVLRSGRRSMGMVGGGLLSVLILLLSVCLVIL